MFRPTLKIAGAEHGLLLTINVGEYDYVEELSTQSGVQVRDNRPCPQKDVIMNSTNSELRFGSISGSLTHDSDTVLYHNKCILS